MKQFLIAAAFAIALAACQQNAVHDGISPANPPAEDMRPATSAQLEGMKARIDPVLSGFVDRGELAGASALVYVGGKEVYFGAFGKADKEAGTDMQRDTLARIYSMTKPVTGVTLMTLYEQGLFKLDEPLETYLPEFRDIRVFDHVDDAGNMVTVPAARKPLVIDILRHTAGFTSGGEDAPVDKAWRATDPGNLDQSITDFSKGLASVPLLYQPGTRWLYGPSVDIQAALVERLTGKPYGDYLQETVLDPLKMTETSYYVPEDKRGRMAMVYLIQDDGTLVPDLPGDGGMNLPLGHHELTPGGYGLVTTVDDYMRFAQMLVNGGELDGVRILKPETIRLMATDHLPDTVGDRSWLPSKGQGGFGIDFAVRTGPPASDDENFGIPGEFFWDGKASTLFWVDPANDLTAVLFVQFVPFGKVPVHHDFRDAVYGVRGTSEAN